MDIWLKIETLPRLLFLANSWVCVEIINLLKVKDETDFSLHLPSLSPPQIYYLFCLALVWILSLDGKTNDFAFHPRYVCSLLHYNVALESSSRSRCRHEC